MSALGQKRTFHQGQPMSALPSKADIAERDRHVRFVPKADISVRSQKPSKEDITERSWCIRAVPKQRTSL
jgi:hypothetical protein